MIRRWYPRAVQGHRAGIARTMAFAAILVALGVRSPGADPVKVDVTTYHNDLGRTGQNTRERVLTPELLRGQVAKRSFRKLWSVDVDGQVYAQPLILTDVPVLVPGSGASKPEVKDLVIVATQNNSVYAFDAAAPAKPGRYLWQWSGNAGDLVPVPADRYVPGKPNLLNCLDIVPWIGITGTPVIDPATRRLYCVTKSLNKAAKIGDPGRYVQRLHAIDLTSGLEVKSRLIEATYPGSGTGIEPGKSVPTGYEADGGYDPKLGTQKDGKVRFLPKCQNQRAGLLLLNGVVYIAWSSHGDQGAYHGWLIGYDAESLDQVSVFNATPNGYEGAIWQGGVAPAADDQGNIYLATGNGPFDADTTFRPSDGVSTTNFGNSVLKFSTRDKTLRVLDYFSPFDRQCLNGSDLDLGSGGVMVLPKQPGSYRLLLSLLGKQGTIFLLDREHFGRPIRKDSDSVVRRISQILGEKYGAGAYFNGSIYYGGGPLNGNSTPVYRLSLAKALDQHRPDFDAQTHRGGESVAGFDLRLMPWGDGSGVPTSGKKNLVIVGIDTSGLLHIRIFDEYGNRVTDTDETELPSAKGGAISALKQQIPGLLPLHVLTSAEKAQVIRDVISIIGQIPVVFALKGTNPSVSADGAAKGILWTIRADGGNENTKDEEEGRKKPPAVSPAVLYAFDATTLELLWASDDAKRGGIILGDRTKFSVPTIANGRVYIGTGISADKKFQGELNVFGAVDR